MKLIDLEIDGFGVWSSLGLKRLSPQINVLYGPNEAGKTTLLEFVRSVLYGFSPARRGNYLPPVNGGRPGGSLEATGEPGRFKIARHDGVPGDVQGSLVILGEDGTLQSDRVLDALLGSIDEAIFNNVFAVGLGELQELATLSDTEAGELLYRITAGLDRVSLVEVLGELDNSRNRLLAADDRPSQIAELLSQHAQLQIEIDHLGKQTQRYVQLHEHSTRMRQQIAELQEQTAQSERRLRIADVAAAVRAEWLERANVEAELAVIETVPHLAPDSLPRLESLTSRIKKGRRRLKVLKRKQRSVREEASVLSINKALERNAARIEALAEQQSWVTVLEKEVASLEREIEQLNARDDELRGQMGLPTGESSELESKISRRRLAPLRPVANAVREASRGRNRTKQKLERSRQVLDAAQTELDMALAARGTRDLSAALDQAGQRVTQLRRRVQLDDRLQQMTDHRGELEEQSHEWLARQMLPGWLLGVLGGLFALGVLLILAGLFLSSSITGAMGWPLALLGVGGVLAAGATKFLSERSAARHLEACEKQLELLNLQLTQASEERDALDAELTHGSGPLSARLQSAEKELAALEEVLPLDAKRQAAIQEGEIVQAQAEQAKEDHLAARKRWRAAVSAGGLPESLLPRHLSQLSRGLRELSEVRRQVSARQAELERRQHELSDITMRVGQLGSDIGIGRQSGASDLMRVLVAKLAEQRPLVQRRVEVERRAKKLGNRQLAIRRKIRRWTHRRVDLLYSAGTASEAEFRRRALENARRDVLKRRQETLAQQIAALVTEQCSSDELTREINQTNANVNGVDRRAQLAAELKQHQEHRDSLLVEQGQVAHEMHVLEDDRRLAYKRLELAVVEKQLDEALDRWQVLAVTHQLLESIRKEYEQHRQPQSLCEASIYLHRLTEGRYIRVWTPLGEHRLCVDDCEGRTLGVERLSRGTREQLFLCLRMALVSTYVRRGVDLPLVLDDVLVNFDVRRAAAAAEVLRDFATEGHQLLIFTCHEHIVKIFEAAGVEVRTLPARGDRTLASVSFERATQKPKRRRTPRPDDTPVPVKAPTAEIEDSRPESHRAQNGHVDWEDDDPFFDQAGDAA